MKKLTLAILVLIYWGNAVCQSLDYNIYHTYINKAETFFFMNENPDSCIHYYNKAFQEFDFVFPHDVANAIQISYYCDKPFRDYLKKGFENGLKMEHLKNILLLKPIFDSLSRDDSLIQEYHKGRKKYLSKIDFVYLREIYDMGIRDQIEKKFEYEKYNRIKKIRMEKIRQEIKEKGFPGVKTIGVGDSHIFGEIGKPQYDFAQQKKEISDKLSYFKVGDETLTSKLILIILIHDQCAFPALEKELKEAITRGEIHPREVGLLYDNMFRQKVNSKKYKCPIPKPEEGVFLLNLFTNYKTLQYSGKSVDDTRAKWNIVSLAVDKKKKDFQKDYGFKLFWGQWKCL